jgi:Cu-Zn family superoxide dismutase
MRLLGLGIFGALAAGCAASEPAVEPAAGMAAGSPGASADVRNVLGQSKAQATVTQLGDTLRVRINASAMPRGTYAAHVHTIGACSPPDFTSAGPHWNPTGAQHGKNNPAGMHKGDLPNLSVGTDGRGTLEYTIPGATLTGGATALLDADGAALVIHAQADDYRTDPTGNAGARMACGVFR